MDAPISDEERWGFSVLLYFAASPPRFTSYNILKFPLPQLISHSLFFKQSAVPIDSRRDGLSSTDDPGRAACRVGRQTCAFSN